MQDNSEHNWLYVTHESQLPQPGDFLPLSLANSPQLHILLVCPNLCLVQARTSLRVIRLDSLEYTQQDND